MTDPMHNSPPMHRSPLAAIMALAAECNALREAVDDLWGCIAKNEIDHLQPRTVELAKANHELLWHS